MPRKASTHSGNSAHHSLTPLAIALAIAVTSLNTRVGNAQMYTLTDIGTLGGNNSGGGGVNNTGQVTGWANISGNVAQHAFLYTPATSSGAASAMIDLGTLPGGINSGGAAVNSAGQVTGWSDTTSGGIGSGLVAGWSYTVNPGVSSGQSLGNAYIDGNSVEHAFLYSPGTPPALRDLGTLGGIQSAGTGINTAGQVTGWADTAFAGPADPFYPSHAFLYGQGANPAMKDLGTLGGATSAGAGINTAGQITGAANVDYAYNPDAFLYSPGTTPAMSDLGTLQGGFSSSCNAINDFGQITGSAQTGEPANPWHAFLYSNGLPIYSKPGMIDLGLPVGGVSSIGYGINSLGEVTGAYVTGSNGQRAFLYINNAMMDLNSLIAPSTPLPPNVTLVQGDAISEQGWIVADGVNSLTGETHAFLLQPSATKTAPVCQSKNTYTSCYLRPTICGSNGFSFCAAACAFPGCVSSLINWTPPVLNGGDPWLDGVSLNILVGNLEQARSLAYGLRVEVSTEPKVQAASERNMGAELISHGALKLQKVSIVGPLIDVAVAEVSPAVNALATLKADQVTYKTDQTVELSLPYDATTVTPGTNVRMVKFDQITQRWIDIGDQFVVVSKHVATAHVSAIGRFTVVVVAQRIHPEIRFPLAAKGKMQHNN
jgi:probable HAF family extracellular repeat protein